MVTHHAGTGSNGPPFSFVPLHGTTSVTASGTPRDRNQLSDATARALDALIAGCDHALLLGVWGANPAADQCRALVARLCADGRDDDPHRAERLVVRLRTTWPTLPSVQRLPFGTSRSALLDRLVSECITAFYVTPDPATPERT
jgi:hypothetical protein